MSLAKDIKYPSFDKSKRVFYEFSSFIHFFEKNRHSVKNVKINPAKIGSKNFGSIEVLVKK